MDKTNLDSEFQQLSSVVRQEKKKPETYIEIPLRSNEGNCLWIKAFRTNVPGLVVHECSDEDISDPNGKKIWRVSHEQSGFMLSPLPLGTRELAESVAEKVAELLGIDWERDVQDLLDGYVHVAEGKTVVVEGIATRTHEVLDLYRKLITDGSKS